MRTGIQSLSQGIRTTPNWLLLAGALAIVFYLVNALHYGQLPLRIEENEWPPMGQAIVETGEPVLAADDSHRVRFTEDLQIDTSPFIGAWHPPLYLYTLAASMVLLGEEASFTLRGIGVVGMLATALLLLLIAREVTPRWRSVGGIAAVLLLIHPYAIQGSLFLDIDNSIYAPLILCLLWLAIRFGQREAALRPAQVLGLGGLLALVAWAKLTTTIVLTGVLVVWWLLARRPIRRSIVEASAFIATGAALFLFTYALWCEITGVPFSYTFDVTFAAKSDRLFGDFLLTENAAKWHLRWIGAALLLLALVYLVDMLRHYLATRRLRPLDLPFLLGLGILANYVVVSPTDGSYQGKYAFPALAALLLPITWMLLREQPRPVSAGRWVLAGAVGLVAALLLPDLITGVGVNGDYGTWTFALRVVAASSAALLIAWQLGGRRGFAGGVICVLVALSVVQAVRSYDAGHSPMYPVADTQDFRAATNDLNRSTVPGDIVVAPKDLGFYLHRRVIEGEDAFARGDARLAAAIARYPRIKAVARNSFGPPIGPETTALLDRCFVDRRTFGTATIAYRSGDCS